MRGRRPHPGPGRGLGGDHLQRLAAVPERGLQAVDPHQVTGEGVPHPGGQFGVRVRAGSGERRTGERDRPVVLPGPRGGGRGAQGERDRVEVPGPGHGVHGAPQVEGALQVPQLLGGCPDPACVVGRLDGRRQRVGEIVALPRVVGPLGALRRAPPAGQEFREHPVQPHPFTRQQIRVDRLPGEGVPELVRRSPVRQQQLAAHRLPQRGLQLVLGKLHGVPQQVVPDPAARHRRRAQHLLGGAGQLLDPDQQQVGQLARQHRPRLLLRRGQQFLRVEGVALGPFDDPADRGVGQRLGAQRPHQPRDLRVRHRPQLQPLHGGQPHQFGEQRAQRVTPVQIVRAVRAEDGEAVGRGTGGGALEDRPAEQETQQVA